MEEEIEEFVDALRTFVEQLLEQEVDPFYCQRGVKIVDARNHMFRLVDSGQTDEAEDVYALADLCRTDEDTFQAVANLGRMRRIAANYWKVR